MKCFKQSFSICLKSQRVGHDGAYYVVIHFLFQNSLCVLFSLTVKHYHNYLPAMFRKDFHLIQIFPSFFVFPRSIFHNLPFWVLYISFLHSLSLSVLSVLTIFFFFLLPNLCYSAGNVSWFLLFVLRWSLSLNVLSVLSPLLFYIYINRQTMSR